MSTLVYERCRTEYISLSALSRIAVFRLISFFIADLDKLPRSLSSAYTSDAFTTTANNIRALHEVSTKSL